MNSVLGIYMYGAACLIGGFVLGAMYQRSDD